MRHLIFLYLLYGTITSAINEPTWPMYKSDFAADDKDIPSMLPADYQIESPVIRTIRTSTNFTDQEKVLDQLWFAQKSKLAQTYVITTRQKLALDIAAGLNDLTDEEFAFMSTQTYVWSDLIGQEPRAFSAILSPSKMRILGDAITNIALRLREKNLGLYITKIISYLDLEDPKILEKLEAFLPAATESQDIEDEIAKKARAFRQRMSSMKNDRATKLASLLIKKIMLARKTRYEKVRDLPPTKEMPQVPKIIEPVKTAPPISTPSPIISLPKEPPRKTVTADSQWRSTKPEFSSWLDGEISTSEAGPAQVKEYIRFILKQFPLEDSDTKNKMKVAIQKTLAQHNNVNRLFDVVADLTEADDIALFVSMLEGRGGGEKSTDANLIELLWSAEKEFIISGASVRERQLKRLASIYLLLSDEQLKLSLNSHNFWVLLEDQPKAAADGLKPSHYQLFAQYFKDHIPDTSRAQKFAQKIVPLLREDDDPEHVYEVLLALAPVTKFVPPMVNVMTFKLMRLGRHLKKLYGEIDGNDMIKKIRSSMKS